MTTYDLHICLHCGKIHTESQLAYESWIEPHGERWTEARCAECGSNEIDEFSYLDYSSELEFAQALYHGMGKDIEDLDNAAEILEHFAELRELNENDTDLTERDDFFRDIANKVELIGAQ